MTQSTDGDSSSRRPGKFLRGPVDFAAGAFLLVFAVLAWWFGQPLKVGTAFRMGPGYVPLLLAWILGAFGVALCALGVSRVGPALERWRVRPLVLVLGALIVFGLTIERTGLFISSLLAVSISAAAGASPRAREIGLLALCLAIGACLLFPLALQLTLKVFP